MLAVDKEGWSVSWHRRNQRRWESANLRQAPFYQSRSRRRAIVGRWRNDVIIGAQSSFPYLAYSIESGKQSLYPDDDADRYQNLISCSLARCQPSLKILCKSVRKFLWTVTNKQTNTDWQLQIEERNYQQDY